VLAADTGGLGISTTLGGLLGTVGTRLGPTSWETMTQERVNQFAELTGDRNFLHVDPDRARETPFGSTIAHGFLSLSLLAPVALLLEVTDADTIVNYGMNKVRFPSPLRVSSRFRGSAEIIGASLIRGGAEVTMAAKLEVEGSDRPVVAAECLFRFYS